MNKTSVIGFNNIGYMTHRFEEEQLSFLREEVNNIKANFSAPSNIPHNKSLAGNLQYEYKLPKSTSKLQELLIPYFIEYDRQFNYMKSITYMSNNVGIVLESLWVNFQKKTEFNPVHNHGGVISFVIYLDIPYSIEDEKKRISSVNSNNPIPAHFSFIYTDSMGQIKNENIPVDNTFRNVLLMFPAKLNHCVYPFYTSDEYRISVSGNFALNTTNSVV